MKLYVKFWDTFWTLDARILNIFERILKIGCKIFFMLSLITCYFTKNEIYENLISFSFPFLFFHELSFLSVGMIYLFLFFLFFHNSNKSFSQVLFTSCCTSHVIIFFNYFLNWSDQIQDHLIYLIKTWLKIKKVTACECLSVFNFICTIILSIIAFMRHIDSFQDFY